MNKIKQDHDADQSPAEVTKLAAQYLEQATLFPCVQECHWQHPRMLRCVVRLCSCPSSRLAPVFKVLRFHGSKHLQSTFRQVLGSRGSEGCQECKNNRNLQTCFAAAADTWVHAEAGAATATAEKPGLERTPRRSRRRTDAPMI